MKAKLSIAIGMAAIAAVAFVAMRPTEAYADWGKVKSALKKAKNVHAVASVRKGDKMVRQEVWSLSGAVRLEAAGQPTKIFKGGKMFVQKAEKADILFELVDVPEQEIIAQGNVTLELVPTLTRERSLNGNEAKFIEVAILAVQEDEASFRIVGTEEIDGRQTEKVILHKRGDPYRTVLWLDPITHLPVVAERQKKNGEIWDVVSQVKYDFTKPIPPSLVDPTVKWVGVSGEGIKFEGSPAKDPKVEAAPRKG